MIRKALIQQIRRTVYGGMPTDDAAISEGLVNQFLNAGIALAAKENLKDNIKIEGISFINSSFYTTFKSLSVSEDENNIYKISLPSLPLGIGRNEGVSSLQFKNAGGTLSLPCVPINESQRTYFQSMRPIPNKTLFYMQGGDVYVISTNILTSYTATVTMVSGGDATDLTSTINIPDDYVNVATDYVLKQLLLLRQQPEDNNNDGNDK